MSLVIPIAHDFTCAWCWVGFHQTRKLKERYPVRFVWKAYEQMPDELTWPAPTLPMFDTVKKPATPSRFSLFAQLHQLELPRLVRPMQMRTHNAHEAVEFSKAEGVADALVEAFYRAYWERAVNINKVENIVEIATGIVSDLDGMTKAIEDRRFATSIVGFDEPAAATGVFNIPTYTIGGIRLAEQPYSVIAKAIEVELAKQDDVEIYKSLSFPLPSATRPTVFINMVSTIDGKTISGERNESVIDLGSKIDHLLMRRIESHADAVILGATTLRATTPKWNPETKTRLVLTESGNVPFDSAYLQNGEAFITTSAKSAKKLPIDAKVLVAGEEEFDVHSLLQQLRDRGIQRLLVYGGSEVNAVFLRAGVVDELFWTIAPKIKLGRDVPTFAGGEPLARAEMLKYSLVSHEVVGDEIFVRYRRKSTI